jgi:hypothetical protein
MALTSTSIQQPAVPAKQPTTIGGEGAASILAALMLTVFAAQKSKKQLRKLKRQAVAQLLKYKVNAALSNFLSIFTKKAPAPISTRTLLYILLGIAVHVLVFIAPVAAIILLLLGILLILLTQY